MARIDTLSVRYRRIRDSRADKLCPHRHPCGLRSGRSLRKLVGNDLPPPPTMHKLWRRTWRSLQPRGSGMNIASDSAAVDPVPSTTHCLIIPSPDSFALNSGSHDSGVLCRQSCLSRSNNSRANASHRNLVPFPSYRRVTSVNYLQPCSAATFTQFEDHEFCEPTCDKQEVLQIHNLATRDVRDNL